MLTVSSLGCSCDCWLRWLGLGAIVVVLLVSFISLLLSLFCFVVSMGQALVVQRARSVSTGAVLSSLIILFIEQHVCISALIQWPDSPLVNLTEGKTKC